MSEDTNKREKRIERWKIMTFYLVIYDIVAVTFSWFLGLWLRFDLHVSEIPPQYLSTFLKFIPFYTLFTVAVFFSMRLYSSLWRYAGYDELNRIAVASVVTAALHEIGITIFAGRMPASYYVIGAVAQFVMIVAVRFGYRFVKLERLRRARNSKAGHRVMVIGAGAAGLLILKELNGSNAANDYPVCVIDDDPNKWRRRIEGVPIEGGRDMILKAAKRYEVEKIMFAIPSASPKDKKDILNICKETGCELKSLPGIYQLINGEASLSGMQNVDVEDLLGREPIKVKMDEIFSYIKGKRILVTGGGGSIGSELCRQIAGHEPEQLVIFEIYENNAYDIEQELRRKYKDLNLVVLIGSVRDSRRLNSVFETYRPQIVYHAAAHKHVPLMETSPNESIKNNVIGTYKTAYAALKNGVERFVLISTDKAVNPTNIMGASKRLCEMVIQSMDAISKSGRLDLLPLLYGHIDLQKEGHTAASLEGVKEELKIESISNKERSGTQFVAVRFGNVLGSNGSVIPLFKKQIAAGGPVTITHPDIVRYFMTIPEAVSLVLQAGTYAWGGEIFVLDMGDPVKIDTLARNLISLSGYKPDEDIKIVYTGLRPGEKLYEEKLMAEEGMMKTDNELIHIGKPIPFDTEEFLKQLEELASACYANSDEIVQMVAKIVPTFHPEQPRPAK